MNTLVAMLGNNKRTVDCEQSKIDDVRALVNGPLEIEVFGKEIFLSLIGSTQDVSYELLDPSGTVLDSDAFKIRF